MPAIASPNVRGNVPILSLSHDAVTIPQALKAAGYVSMLAGKWHLGHPKGNWPGDYGFDEFWGSLAGTPGYYNVKDAYHNETPIEVDGYFTDRITDKAIAFIELNFRRPFFLYLSYNAPHYPLEAPEELIAKYEAVYDHPLFPVYAAMVERMDYGIGRVLNELDRRGLAANTLVIFTADNGSPDFVQSKIPGKVVSRARRMLGDTGTHVPFFASWPGTAPAGTVSAELVDLTDILPTLAELAGARLPQGVVIDGRSFAPQLQGQRGIRRAWIFTEWKRKSWIRNARWKLYAEGDFYDLDSDPDEARRLGAGDLDEEGRAARRALESALFDLRSRR